MSDCQLRDDYISSLSWPFAKPFFLFVFQDEITYLPVYGYIDNYYYDDHFDLYKNSLKLGKTLVMLSQGHNDLMGNSYRLVGWAHYEKFDNGLRFLREIIEKGEANSLASEAVSEKFF